MIDTFFHSETFKKNLDLFSQTNPLEALQLDLIWDSYRLKLVETEQGEPNLFHKRYGINDYYHDPKGAMHEAQEIAKLDAFKHAPIIYFYGLGLGYIYDAVKPWLKANKKRYLILLEDDLEVLYYFFHTERATELLQDSQVILFYFQTYPNDYKRFYQLYSNFLNEKFDFLSLPYYAIRRSEETVNLGYYIFHDTFLITMLHNEYLTGQGGFLSNFYHNIFHLPNSHVGSGLFGKFQNIPAIICGAGPSLQKNIHLLKKLKNQALIFAGGSSLNVLNAANIYPHFGLGVDPNLEQYHRLLTNDTFHLPYFYRLRVSHEALKVMPGPKLLIPGSANLLTQWFERELNILSPSIDEGHNVVNLCTEVAYRLGCNPIIYVGMDLAFTQEIQPYALGIQVHPLWIEKSHPYQTDQEQELIWRQDIYQQPIRTKWDWILEANWLGHFAKHHSELTMINATEGGLGFPPVPNLTLSEVIDQFLSQAYDIDSLVHAEIQESSKVATQFDLMTLLKTMYTSVKRCMDIISTIIDHKTEQLSRKYPSETLNFYDTSTIIQEVELHQEIAYSHFLALFENANLYLERAKQMGVNRQADPFFILFKHYKYLYAILEQHANLIDQAVQRFIFFHPPQSYDQNFPLLQRSPKESYRFQDHDLYMIDPTLEIFIHEPFTPDPPSDLKKAFYPDSQQIKNETYYLKGELHGPSRFYGSTGRLLSESWFYHGQRHGKTIQYYASGQLYSILGYRHGQFHGKQEYFYENGFPHVILHYDEGRLEGKVKIYTETGILLRELHYHQGQRHGWERMWNKYGSLLMECQYDQGKPNGQGQLWASNGQLIKEVTIHHFPQDFDVKILNSNGEIIQEFIHGVEDLTDIFKQTELTAQALEENIETIFQQLDPMEMLKKFEDMAKNYPDLDENVEAMKPILQEFREVKQKLVDSMQKDLEKAEKTRKEIKADIQKQDKWEDA